MTRDDLITENLDLASDVAQRFRRSLVEYEDLVQEATLALVKAADDYDDTLGVEFGKFARIRMKFALLKVAAVASERPDRGGSINVDAIADELDGDLFDEVWDAVEQLPESDQPVIIKMFGLDGEGRTGRRAISQALGRTDKSVRLAQSRSLKTLKHLLRA
jgi:RNA polymerase sigma factor (sigma-70 family)